MKEMKIAIVARTVGFEYDDRIRKESVSLSKIADVHIFVNFTDNREEKGVTSYGIPYTSFRLKTRDRLPSTKCLFVKSIEFYLLARKHLAGFDIIWAHEAYTYLFPLLLSKKVRCVWDLHEIPVQFEKRLMKPIFHFIERNCIMLLHANSFRINYLAANKTIRYPDKHLAIRNYPDQEFAHAQNISDQLSQFLEWLEGGAYIYLQGLSSSRRYPFNTIDAVMGLPDLKAIVVGGFDKMAKKKLEQKYGDELYKKVNFVGMIDQLQIPALISGAIFSIVLYDTHTPNNKFCEPNRMYQAIAMGVPVIVGCNEPMKELVEKYEFGIVLDSDGRDMADIGRAINRIKKNNGRFRKKIHDCRDKIGWETQEAALLGVCSIRKNVVTRSRSS